MLVAEEIAATIEREGPRVYGGGNAARATQTGSGAAAGGDLLPQIAKLVGRRGPRLCLALAAGPRRPPGGSPRPSCRTGI